MSLGIIKSNQKIGNKWKDEERNDPALELRSDDKRVVLHNKGESISINKMDEILKKLKWCLYYVGCDSYAIINHRGQRTNMILRETQCAGEKDVEMKLWDDELMFGGDDGTLCVMLRGQEIDGQGGAIHISLSDHNYISFYNFDKVLEKSEEYMRSLPKEFVMKELCKYCKKVMNTTYTRSALHFHTNFLTSMARVFQGARCEKCGTGGMSFGTDTFYYRKKTDRRVKDEVITKIAKKQKVEWKRLWDIERKEEEEIKRKREAEKEEMDGRKETEVNNSQRHTEP